MDNDMITSDTSSTKDIFAVCQQNVDKFLDSVKQSVPRYHQSIANTQQECLSAYENFLRSTITLQKEFAKRADVTTNVPDAALKIINDSTEEMIQATLINNQVTLATIDATQQNIKTFNDNAKAFADMNKNILDSWITAISRKE
jgi:hypothetical protein